MDKLSIVFSSAISDLETVNSSFDKGILQIAYWGANANKTYISKEAFEAAVPSMFNCPVVCRYDRETDSIGGHDVELVTKDGRKSFVNVTTPVGLVPESARPFWKEVEEESGVTHEYLCVPILVWKRQEAYDHIKANGITDESMEIRVKSGRADEDGYYHIESFEFTAFCLLERDAPCFESALIKLFSEEGMARFSQEYSRMLDDFKMEFSTVNSAAVAVDINAPNGAEDCSKGGNGALKGMKELMTKYGISEKDIDFDPEGMDDAELEAQFRRIAEAKDMTYAGDDENGGNEQEADESGAEPDADGATGDDTSGSGEAQSGDGEDVNSEEEDDASAPGSGRKYSLTGNQLTEEICDALRKLKYIDARHPDWGEMTRYWYIDFDAEAGEVYAYDDIDWKVYGMAYRMDGDKVVIDFDSAKRKKLAFVDFDMGSEASGYTGIQDGLEERFGALGAVVDELKKFKADVESERRNAAEKEVFARFADIADDERFVQLREGCADMSLEEIEDKCFAIRGRAMKMDFSRNESGSVRLPVESFGEDPDEPYGGAFVEYGIG